MRPRHTTARRFSPGTRSAVLFIAPSLVVIAVVLFYPLLRSMAMGLTNRIFGIQNFSFVGLENYAQMAADPLFRQALANSAKLTLLNVSGMLLLGLSLALALNSHALRFRAFFVAVLFLPWAMPSMVITLMFRWLYNDIYGYPNYALMTSGLISEPVNLLADKTTAWIGILLPLVWCFYPFVMLVFLSALQSIDRTLYEAAEIDGANAWSSFRHVTWPALKPVVLIVIILESIWSFATFDLVWLLTEGGPANSTLTLSVYVYKQGFVSRYLGYASALGTVMFLVLLCFTLLYLWALKRSRLYDTAA